METLRAKNAAYKAQLRKNLDALAANDIVVQVASRPENTD